MAPKLYPENPLPKTPGEAEVLEILQNELSNSAEIFCNYHFMDGNDEREIDFIVLWPGHGIMFIEVKDDLIMLDEEGFWRNRHRVIYPDKQVTAGMYGIRKMVEDSNKFPRKLRSSWLVVFTDTELKDTVFTRTLPRDRIVDKFELPTLRDKIMSELHDMENPTRNTDELEIISKILREKRIESEIIQDQWADIDAKRMRLTEEQFRVLSIAEDMPAFVVKGPAGSGKTYLALEQSKRHTRAGRKTALICYNEGLAAFLQKTVNAWPISDRPAYVGTFHRLLETVWKVKVPPNPSDDFWTIEAPKTAQEHLNRKQLEKFDAFVVDEAQDFSTTWWDTLSLAYQSPSEPSYMAAFGDTDQNIFKQNAGRGLPPEFHPLKLHENLRCAQPIVDLANLLLGTQIPGSGLIGGSVEFYQCKTENAYKGADEALDAVMRNGWDPSHCLLLTTKSRHPMQLLLSENGNDKQKYWSEYFETTDAFYSNVYAFKGLEEPVVVIAIDGWWDTAKPKELLYTAITRAVDKVVIAGDIDLIRSEFGNDFADFLLSCKKGEYDPTNEISAAQALAEVDETFEN